MLRSYKDLVITDLLILLYIRTSGIYISPFMVMYRTMTEEVKILKLVADR